MACASHNASGDRSPRVFVSKLSKLLKTLNALADLLSSSNSDLESMLSCTCGIGKIKGKQSVIKHEGIDFGCIHRSSGVGHSVELKIGKTHLLVQGSFLFDIDNHF